MTTSQLPSIRRAATAVAAPTTRTARTAGLGTGLLALAGTLGIAVTTEGPGRTGELHLDQLLAVDREAPLVWLANLVHVALGPVVGPLLVALVCAVVFLRGHRWAAVALALSTMVGWFSVGAGKLVFARHRPPTASVHAVVIESGYDSFPSGHTALAAAFVGGVVLALRVSGRSTRTAWLVGVPFVVMVAASRLYLGVHYLGDVVASLLFAGGTILLFAAIATAVGRRLGWWADNR